jgi:hypothetical protein
VTETYRALYKVMSSNLKQEDDSIFISWREVPKRHEDTCQSPMAMASVTELIFKVASVCLKTPGSSISPHAAP